MVSRLILSLMTLAASGLHPSFFSIVGLYMRPSGAFQNAVRVDYHRGRSSCFGPSRWTGKADGFSVGWRRDRNSANCAKRGVPPTRMAVDDAPGGTGFSDLSNALSRLDSEWERAKRNDWIKLSLNSPKTEAGRDNDAAGTQSLPDQQDFVYLLEPAYSSVPSSVILFLGGAALGQYPHIVYNEFLKRISNKTGAAVIAAPYQVSLDHFEIAKQSEKLFRRALQQCEDERGWKDSLPKIALAHSLGAKLFTISMAATGSGLDMQGIGFLSFNNFGLSDSIGMATSFAKDLRSAQDPFAQGEPSRSPYGSDADSMMDFFVNLAEQGTKMMGLDFSPSPRDMERLIELRFPADLQAKCRLFSFDDDDMDSSEGFVNACKKDGSCEGPSVSGLSGSHLTPVYVNFDLNDLPLEAQMVTGGIQAASFGSEKEMNAAADEVCDWIVGKPPTRGPRRKDPTSDESKSGRTRPGILDAETA